MKMRFVFTRRDRGSFMLGFASLSVVLSVMCASALLRSMETYQTSALSVEKMQARAAAEGAAVAWAHGALQPNASMQVGECIANLSAAADPNLANINVEVHRKGSTRAAIVARYIASADAATSASRQLRRLELLQ